MIHIQSIFAILNVLRLATSGNTKTMDPFVVGGVYAKISTFPHSAFLNIFCVQGPEIVIPWICGSSILTERILLTAAHCLDGCGEESYVTVHIGHEHKDLGAVTSMLNFILHENFISETTENDIALVRLRTPLTFGINVQRVALMEDPPYSEKAQIAGWGAVNELVHQTGDLLKYVDQYVWKREDCVKVMEDLPTGVICASSDSHDSYSSRGDSGSALVVRGYIQIGIVSYKIPKVSRSLVVYTDTGYFYDWIKKNTRRLYCV